MHYTRLEKYFNYLYYYGMAHLLRTRFAKDIVAEFLPPSSARVRAAKRQRVIILCDGVPVTPNKQALVEWMSKKGFWVIYPRYRGTWESDGVFLRYPLDKDVLDIIDALPKGFASIFDGKRYRVRTGAEIFIIGSSSGGPAAILASRDPRVKKVVAMAPVVDWRAQERTAEPFHFMERFVREAFGNGYRVGKKEWAKLKAGKFYSPVHHQKEIDGSKLFIFQAKDDTLVHYQGVVRFAEECHAKLVVLKKGGHLSIRTMVPKYWKQIARFFSS